MTDAGESQPAEPTDNNADESPAEKLARREKRLRRLERKLRRELSDRDWEQHQRQTEADRNLVFAIVAISLVVACFASAVSKDGFSLVRAGIGSIGFFFMGVISAMAGRTTAGRIRAAAIGIGLLALALLVVMGK